MKRAQKQRAPESTTWCWLRSQWSSGKEVEHWSVGDCLEDALLEFPTDKWTATWVMWEEVLNFVGSLVSLDGNVSCAAAQRTAHWRRLKILQAAVWQSFWCSSSTSLKDQRRGCDLECSIGGDVGISTTTAGNGGRPVVGLLHRPGNGWIVKSNTSLISGNLKTVFSMQGHGTRMNYKEPCARALRGRKLAQWRWIHAQ